MSDAERERIRYVVAETSGLSQQKLSQKFGISTASSRKMKVEAALSKAMDIRESIYKLSSIKEKAILMYINI